jgi:hypothetical protein
MNAHDLPPRYQAQLAAQLHSKPATKPLPKDGLTGIRCQPSADEAKLNKTEREYLGLLRSASPAWIGVQAVTLKLGDDCRYTPDFVVLDAAGVLWAHEVKGFMRDDALVKLKVAARKFNWIRFVLARKEKGAWEVKEVSP